MVIKLCTKKNLLRQEEEHEQEIAEMKAAHDKEIDQLKEIIADKQSTIDNLNIEKRNAEDEKSQLTRERDKAIAEREER